MALRRVLAVFACAAWFASAAQSQTEVPSAASGLRSSIQATGVGTVELKPTILRLSVPIKVVSDSAWDATEELRRVRRAVVERATEMGAIEGSLQVFAFHCGEEQTLSFNPRGETSDPKFAARCYVVADFPLRAGEDHEETMGLSQAQLGQLVSLLPEPESNRRSYSVSTLASGLTSQQLENPLVLFVAKVSPEDKAQAFKQALQSARSEVEATLSAIGLEAANMTISHSPNYSSLRQSHPLEPLLDGSNRDEASGIYADQVSYSVRLIVIGHVNQ